MASKYAERFALPEGFPVILKDFTREVLRSQTESINMFAYNYFSSLQRERAGGGAAEALNPVQLQENIGAACMEADPEDSGLLDHRDFKRIFQKIVEECNLPESDLAKLMAEADELENGAIEYRDFIPVAADIIVALQAKNAQPGQEQPPLPLLLHGMSSDELVGLMSAIFKNADADGTGFLIRPDFRACLQEADLGFTRKEINALMGQVDSGEEGMVEYEPLLAFAYGIVATVLQEQLGEMPSEEGELAAFFVDLFRSADTNEEGVLHVLHVKELLRQADLGLSRVQIHAAMGEAQEDGQGFVAYADLANAVAPLVLDLVALSSRPDMAQRVQAVRQTDAYYLVLGLDRDALDAALLAAFAAMDPSGQGVLPRPAVRLALQEGLPQLTARQTQALMSVVEPDEENQVAYEGVLQWAFPTLQMLQEQEMIMS